MNTTIQLGPPKKKLSIFIFILNVVACFEVVLLHTSLPVYSPSNTLRWVEMVALQAVSISAVPVFFMISGMNLLGYRERYSTSIFFKKRLWKTGRAFVVGSAVCYIILSVFPRSFYSGKSFEGTFGFVDFVKRFLTNNINDTYWFFFSIIYLYVLTPILSHATRSKRTMEYLIVLLFGVSVGIPWVERFGLNETYLSLIFDWPMFSSIVLLYFCLGFYLYRYVPVFKYQKSLSVIVVVCTTLSMFVLGLWSNGYHKASGLNAQYDPYFIGMNSPFCVIQTVAMFLLFESLEKNFKHISERGIRVFRIASNATLGVYLFHILLIDWLGVHLSEDAVIMRSPVLKGLIVYSIAVLVVIVGKRLIQFLRSAYLRIWLNLRPVE